MERQIQAAQYFLDGYNCAQAVFAAFSDITGLSPEYSARMASSFGGGMGRMREVCGAVSGMLMVTGILYGYDPTAGDEVKQAHYALVQKLAGQFREEAGSIICRELLENPPSDPKPTPRTKEFYEKRPCAHFVMLATRILEDYIRENPPVK